MNIAAFDLSLVATGWAESRDSVSGVISFPKLRGIDRLIAIRNRVMVAARGADLVVLEGFAWGAKGNAVLDLAMLGGVVRVALTEAGLTYVEVNPSSLKKFATGKGNAKKDEVFAAAIRKLDYQGTDHNEADALWLLQMAVVQYTISGSHPATGARSASSAQLDVLAKVAWPELAVRTSP